MRKRQAAATTAHSCHRCTAILHSESGRCTMCGWPVGVGYPADDSAVTAAITSVEGDSEDAGDAAVEDHTGAQLDALSSMVDRQTMEAAPAEMTVTVDEVEQVEEATIAEDAKVEAQTPELVMAQSSAVVAPAKPAAPEPIELDPLTAPLEQLEGRSSMAPTTASTQTEPADPTAADIDSTDATSPDVSTQSASPAAADDSEVETAQASDAQVDVDQADLATEAEDDEPTKASSKTLPLLLALLVVLGLALVGVYTLL